MAIPKDALRQPGYLSRLASTGASALAISKDLRAPKLCPEFLQEADRLQFPVLLVSIEVPFVVIARIVIMANQDASHRELVRQLSIFDALRATDAVADLGALFVQLEQVSGYHLFLSSASGTPLLPRVPAFPEEYREYLSRPSAAPAYVLGGYVVSVPIAGRVAGYLLGLRLSDVEPGSLATLQHIATIAALQRAILEREREIDRREGGELLAGLLKGQDPAELADRVPEALRNQSLALVLIQTGDSESGGALLHQRLTDLDCPHLMLSQQEIVMLAPVDAPLLELLTVLPDTHAGRSRALHFGEGLAVPEHQARLAMRRAIDRDEVLVDSSLFAAELDWLPPDPALTRELLSRVLGPILSEDEARASSRLVETLRAWLDSGQRPGEAARRLGIHPHTLSYRLRRIEELTGRDLSAPASVTEFWLALRLSEEDA
jgi:purine catabolism regulator